MKLRKRLPESRSQKRERLAGERERRAVDRDLALKRREMWLQQQEENLDVWKTWRRAVNRRLESEEAYARFEATHRALWDFFRHVGLPAADTTIAIQRWRDGLPFEVEPIVAWVEDGPRQRDLPLWRLLRRQRLDEGQKERLRTMALRLVDLPYWHRGFREGARLARVLDGDAFRAALGARRLRGGESGARAAAMLAQLEQARRMGTGR